MKNIKILFTSLLFILIAASCDNDGGTSVIDVIEGATPDFRKEPTTDQGINIIALQNNEDINIGLNLKVATGQVKSMNILGYFTQNGVVTKAVIQSNVSSFPAKLNYKTADLVKVFPTFTSFGLNDKLTISADLTLTNGTVIKIFNDDGTPNYGADIANSTIWKVSQTYTALCPLDDASLFNGNYEVIADDWEDYKPGTIIPVVYNGTDGTYTFRILETKNPAIDNPTTAYLLVTINPATNAITVKSNIDFDYGGDTTPVTGTGTVGSCTGDINLKLNFPGFGRSALNFDLVKSN
ncbi:hypothetical protein NJT12_03810 [Flavobacterium sp. AC]|uniref:DUF5689 domain-containing protein n=1 Tax=Flavobacterium azizsancarii TaxID=2961580 RepID=A0ABT4W868_9FLAO|nr:hypothetical protein [Flavobacterium azizsancarii]MDA6068738.1 hypothetical protein [Flavobacterium azizsancarii]